MQTVQETRRSRLAVLVKKHGGMANLVELLGFARTDTARLTRIHNKNVRHERGGKLYEMGDDIARQIEVKLDLPIGWMDTPLTYQELYNEEDPRSKVIQAMEQLPAEKWPTLLRLVDAFTQPEQSNGGASK